MSEAYSISIPPLCLREEIYFFSRTFQKVFSKVTFKGMDLISLLNRVKDYMRGIALNAFRMIKFWFDFVNSTSDYITLDIYEVKETNTTPKDIEVEDLTKIQVPTLQGIIRSVNESIDRFSLYDALDTSNWEFGVLLEVVGHGVTSTNNGLRMSSRQEYKLLDGDKIIELADEHFIKRGIKLFNYLMQYFPIMNTTSDLHNRTVSHLIPSNFKAVKVPTFYRDIYDYCPCISPCYCDNSYYPLVFVTLRSIIKNSSLAIASLDNYFSLNTYPINSVLLYPIDMARYNETQVNTFAIKLVSFTFGDKTPLILSNFNNLLNMTYNEKVEGTREMATHSQKTDNKYIYIFPRNLNEFFRYNTMLISREAPSSYNWNVITFNNYGGEDKGSVINCSSLPYQGFIFGRSYGLFGSVGDFYYETGPDSALFAIVPMDIMPTFFYKPQNIVAHWRTATHPYNSYYQATYPFDYFDLQNPGFLAEVSNWTTTCVFPHKAYFYNQSIVPLIYKTKNFERLYSSVVINLSDYPLITKISMFRRSNNSNYNGDISFAIKSVSDDDLFLESVDCGDFGSQYFTIKQLFLQVPYSIAKPQEDPSNPNVWVLKKIDNSFNDSNVLGKTSVIVHNVEYYNDTYSNFYSSNADGTFTFDFSLREDGSKTVNVYPAITIIVNHIPIIFNKYISDNIDQFVNVINPVYKSDGSYDNRQTTLHYLNKRKEIDTVIRNNNIKDYAIPVFYNGLSIQPGRNTFLFGETYPFSTINFGIGILFLYPQTINGKKYLIPLARNYSFWLKNGEDLIKLGDIANPEWDYFGLDWDNYKGYLYLVDTDEGGGNGAPNSISYLHTLPNNDTIKWLFVLRRNIAKLINGNPLISFKVPAGNQSCNQDLEGYKYHLGIRAKIEIREMHQRIIPSGLTINDLYLLPNTSGSGSGSGSGGCGGGSSTTT